MDLEDDPTLIPAASVVCRRIPPTEIIEEGGARRVKSSAFTHSSDGSGTSVVVAHLMGEEAGRQREPRDILRDHPDCEVWTLSAEEARSAGESKGHRLGLKHEPEPDEPGHANIKWPAELGTSARHRVRRILAERAFLLDPSG